jgi:integrase
MPKRAKELTAMAVRNLVEPGLYFVGVVPGLALQIKPSGARSWVLRAAVGGRRREIGLGPFPAVTLAGAHEAAREARKQITSGVDPIEQRRAAQSALRAAKSAQRSFRTVAEDYIKAHEPGWKNQKHAAQWRSTLETHAYPILGSILVADVTKENVIDVLTPIWTTLPETASRVRGRIESVLSYAMQRGLRPEGLNPARWRGGLDKVLAATSKVKKVEHFAAMPIDEVGAFMTKLRAANGVGARCLEFAILTAARSNEARGALWSEIDIENRLWTIPAERMKAEREHRVPLSEPAIELLKALDREPGSDLVFTAPRGGVLSDSTLTATIKRLGAKVTQHGFRSSFRDWVSERTNFPNEAAELALAHVVSDRTEAAYRRGDQFMKRVAMMQAWAEFVGRETRPAEVVSIVRAA